MKANRGAKRDGFSRPGDPGDDPDRGRMARRDGGLLSAHVESGGIHRPEHCHHADRVGRFVDELRGAEHRTDALPRLRLHAGAFR